MLPRRFSQGSVDDDGFTVHQARNILYDRESGRHFRSSMFRSSSAHRRESTRRSVLSQTSEAAAQRGFFLPSGGIGASVFNLCSATLGAGVLALPKCGEYSGWLLTSIYVFLSGSASCYAIVVLVMVSNMTNLMSYEEMSLKILGSRRWVWASVLLIALLCFGTAVGYIITIGDILDPFRAIKGAPAWMQGQKGRYLSQVGWWVFIFLPASLPKHVNALRLGSLCGVFSVAFLLLMMSIHYGLEENHPPTAVVQGGAASLFSLPVIMFGYGCQVNTFEIYREMYQPSTKRMTIVAVIALTLCSSFYISAGVIGYLNFGSSVLDNVLKNFNPTDNVMATVSFLGMSITVTMAFPLCVFPTRDAFQFLIWPPTDEQIQEDLDEAGATSPAVGKDGQGIEREGEARLLASSDHHSAGTNYSSTAEGANGSKNNGLDNGSAEKKQIKHDTTDDQGGEEEQEETGMSDSQRQIMVTVICLLILLSGLFIPSITTAFGVIGGLCIGPIGYSIPALFAIKSGHWTVANVGRMHVICVYVLFGYGVVCAVLGTGISVYQIVASA